MTYLNKRHVYLIGMMGAGKSTIGQLLASELKFEFFDTDSEVEKDTGKSISTIFLEKGESYFRELEEIYLEKLIKKKKKCIVACGGGLPLNPKNMDKMKQTGIVIFLKSTSSICFSRIKDQTNRPLLINSESFHERYSDRMPIYEQASYTCNTDRAIKEIISELKKILADFIL